jgi:hypothetical protein
MLSLKYFYFDYLKLNVLILIYSLYFTLVEYYMASEIYLKNIIIISIRTTIYRNPFQIIMYNFR